MADKKPASMIDQIIAATKDRISYFNSVAVLAGSIIAVTAWALGLFLDRGPTTEVSAQQEVRDVGHLHLKVERTSGVFEFNPACQASLFDKLPLFTFDQFPIGCYWWSIDNLRASEDAWVARLRDFSDRLHFTSLSAACDEIARLSIRFWKPHQKEFVDGVCFKRFEPPEISARAKQLIRESHQPAIAKLTNWVDRSTHRTTLINEPSKCKDSGVDVEAVVKTMRLLLVYKALALGEAVGSGDKVYNRIKLGTGPLDSLFDLGRDILPAARDNVASEDVMAGIYADYLLDVFNDQQLYEIASRFHGVLPEQLRQLSNRAAVELLKFYEAKIKPRRLSIKTLYSEYSDRILREGYQNINRMDVFHDYVLEDAGVSCMEQQIGRFWIRRLIRGTDERVAILMGGWIRKYKEN